METLLDWLGEVAERNVLCNPMRVSCPGSGVYAFGFLSGFPQLYVNYKVSGA